MNRLKLLLGSALLVASQSALQAAEVLPAKRATTQAIELKVAGEDTQTRMDQSQRVLEVLERLRRPVPEQPGATGVVPRNGNFLPYPVLDGTPKFYRLVASNDPREHLGVPHNPEMDVVSWEAGSDWRHHAPLTDAIATHTRHARNDLERVAYFNAWLNTTKPYDYPSFTQPPTIIDMLNFTTGVCWQNSSITSSAARLMGVPTMSVATLDNNHQYNRVYADGADGKEWMIVNGNFGNAMTAISTKDGGPRELAGFEDRLVDMFHDVRYNASFDMGGNARLKRLGVYKQSIVDESERAARYTTDPRNGLPISVEYGTVEWPHSIRQLYGTIDGKISPVPIKDGYTTMLMYRFEALDEHCLADIGIGYTGNLKHIFPTMHWRGITEDGRSYSLPTWASGRFETVLPTATGVVDHPSCGSYRLHYFFGFTALNDPADQMRLAYVDFRLQNKNDTIIIQPFMLRGFPGTRPENVEYIRRMLEEIPQRHELPLSRY